MTKIHQIIDKFNSASALLAGLELKVAISDANISGHPPLFNFYHKNEQILAIASVLDDLHSRRLIDTTQTINLLKGLLSVNTFYGFFCQLMAYSWLHTAEVDFKPNALLEKSDVFNQNGSELDGKIKPETIYFDVKGFGIQEYVQKEFKERLEARMPQNHVSIEGSLDSSYEDINKHAFGSIDDHCRDLKTKNIVHIPELGWVLRRHESNAGVITDVGTYNPYRFAEENVRFPLKKCSQFTKNHPFLLVCPFDFQLLPIISQNFNDIGLTALRALSRRAFIQFLNDSSLASSLDNKAEPGVKLCDISRYLSAILFLNICNAKAWLFTNPNAVHKDAFKRRIEANFDFKCPSEDWDNFMYDNY